MRLQESCPCSGQALQAGAATGREIGHDVPIAECVPKLADYAHANAGLDVGARVIIHPDEIVKGAEGVGGWKQATEWMTQ